MKPFSLFIISFISVMLISPGVALAAPVPVGSVVAVRGEALAIGEDGPRPLAIKSAVFLKDTLKTGERGRLQVLFEDATIISVGPGSQMTVEDYEWNGTSGKMENNVKEGFFHIMGGNIAKKSPEQFNTQTPIATIGIRGSTYAVRLVDDELSVVFIGGTGIRVFNDMGTVEIDLPGYGTQLTQKLRKLPMPRKFTESELEGILKHTAPDKGESPEMKNSKPIAPKKDASPHDLFTESMTRINDVESEVIDNRQKEEENTIEDVTTDGPDIEPPPPPTVYNFTGAYMNMLVDPDENILALNRFSKGTLTAESQGGHVTADGESDDGLAFLFNFDMPEVDPDGQYTGPVLAHSNLMAFPLTGFAPDTLFSADRYNSPLGEFAILSVPKEAIEHEQEPLAYSMLGFIGIPAVQNLRPQDVIYEYTGPASGFSRRLDDEFFDGGIGWMTMRVNWHNNRFMGFLESESDDLNDNAKTPFFGTIKSDTPVIDQAVFMGNFDSPLIDGPDPGGSGDPYDFVPISWLTGSDTGFGRFYGSQYQGFGGLAQGGIVDIESDHSDFSGEWQLAGAGFRVPSTETAPHGNVVLEGFVVGVGENMTAPHLNPRFFMNQSTSDFTMTIDKDAGEITGSLSAVDLADNSNSLSNINIGGGFGSAFVDDDLYVALLGSTNGVHNAGDSGGLKKYGNHLAPTDPNVQLAEHTTWGYWEIAYDDPATQEPFHVHVPGSLWIAGQVTSEDKIQDLIQTSHMGHYDGKAIGAMTSPEHPDLVGMVGTVQMAIDFSPSSQSPVAGDIHFAEPDIHLAIENGSVGPTGFSGSFQNTLKSELNGAFFGPNADAVAGNFAAILEQETAITGVFGADVQ